MSQLVLSLFPGMGLLDRAFEESGYCVVRGPDQLWGGDIKQFNPPRGVFNGIIGGPPCQAFSRLAYIVEHNHKREPDKSFTVAGIKKMIGNGVALPMGRAIVRAIRSALEDTIAEVI